MGAMIGLGGGLVSCGEIRQTGDLGHALRVVRIGFSTLR